MSEALGTLHVCAVPIGNLDDASPRLRRVLGQVHAIACEDTRTTGRLLTLLGVEGRPRLLAHHAHNEQASATGVVALLEAGHDVALVSDAGSPAVSDPGVLVVAAARAAGVPVVAVPGPSAVAAALGVAGLHGDGYRFVGFLPRAEDELTALARTHARELLVAFEAPTRLAQTLAVLASAQGDRQVRVCRELTKLHEQVHAGTCAELAAWAAERPVRGEVVLVLAPLDDAAAGEDAELAGAAAAIALARDLVEAGLGTKQAARVAAAHLGGSSRALYAALLADVDRPD